ncbi:MAG: DUF362 domain-containing protein [Acidimicrobiales bacterium]
MGLDGESSSGAARVAVVSNPGASYPGVTNGFAAGSRDGNGSLIDDMVEKALRLAGSSDRPRDALLGDWIPPGSRVFVLPNLVMHRRTERGETTSRFLAKCTNASVVRPLLRYIVEAAGDWRLVGLGSAPLQACDYGAAVREAGFMPTSSESSSDPMAGIQPTDLRGIVTVWSKYGSLRERHSKEVPTVQVDLGALSLLDELYSRNGSVDFRVGDYAPDETMSFHSEGRHVYTIHRDILESDVIVSVPKLKTHEKVGITCALKGTIGTVTRKECLAHYRHDSQRGRGDELPQGNPLRSLASEISDRSFASPDTPLGNAMRVVGKGTFRLARLGHHGIMGGGWSGNDTAWRMALDVARILRFARPDGKIANSPQRSHLVLVDGIVGGEGEGPLSPSPVPAGVLVFSDDPVAADVTCARLMGYDPGRIPLLMHAMNPSMPLPLRSWDTCVVQWDEDRFTDLDSIPSVLGRPFRPPKGWIGSIERSAEISNNA